MIDEWVSVDVREGRSLKNLILAAYMVIVRKEQEIMLAVLLNRLTHFLITYSLKGFCGKP